MSFSGIFLSTLYAALIQFEACLLDIWLLLYDIGSDSGPMSKIEEYGC